MSVPNEATGLIKHLAEVVKSQQSTQQHALQKTANQLQTLSNTVASLTQNLPQSFSCERLDHFLSQLESILKGSGKPPKFVLICLNNSHIKIVVLLTRYAKLKMPTLKLWAKIYQ